MTIHLHKRCLDTKHTPVYLCTKSKTHMVVQTHKLGKCGYYDCHLAYIPNVLNTPECTTKRLRKDLGMYEAISSLAIAHIVMSLCGGNSRVTLE